MNIKTVTMRGRKWKITPIAQNGDLGACQAPNIPDKEMDIPIDGDTRDELRVIIHECLHACLWDLDEEAVDETSTDIARLLWRLGWRNES